MYKKIIFLLAIALIFSAVPAFASDTSDKEKVAVVVAKKWLTLIDHGEYKQGWKDTSTLFKKFIKQGQWEEALVTIRKPLGKMLERKIESKAFRTSMPSVPDGEYVVIRFKTSFENKASAIETVTPMKDKDGQWHVSGYVIK